MPPLPARVGSLRYASRLARNLAAAGDMQPRPWPWASSDFRCLLPRPAACCSGYELGKRVAPKNAGLASDLTAALIAQVRACRLPLHDC